jgi:hypothetical protein
MDNDIDKDKTASTEIPEIEGESIVVSPIDDKTEEPKEDSKAEDSGEDVDSVGDDSVANEGDEEDAGTGEKEESTEEHLRTAIAEQAREDERPHSSNFSLRKILGGDILTASMLRNNIWLIVLVVGFVILYITNRYKVQKDLLEIDELDKELVDAKYRALSVSSNLTEKSRESHVLDNLKNGPDSSLKQSDKPPYIVEVPEK